MTNLSELSLFLISHNIVGFEYGRTMWSAEYENNDIFFDNDLYEHSVE